MCFWDGILCDPNDQATVTGVFMPGSGYSGTLPTMLGALQTLKEISMPQNEIRGRIPTEIAGLPHLETLNLAENEVTGSIPAFLSRSLGSVDLSQNLLAGTLDPQLGVTHRTLTDWDVTHNKISGLVPASFGTADRLDTLALSENRFSGTLPASLGTARNLKYLYLDNNFLMGTIPPEIARQNSPLEELWLQENLLSGTIPAAIADLKQLFNFYIDGNKFTGSVPKQLCREEINADFFEAVTDDEDQDRNFCDSIACEPGFVSYEGLFPCSQCEEEYFNPYLGRVGQCIDLKEDDILDDFYEAARGEDWVGGVNWQVAGIPKCKMTGISCDANDNIVGIDLKDKGLRGTIPESIGFLQFLERLDLSDNSLTGFLPSDLRWAPLEFLDVTGNDMRGIVPTELCKKEGINGNGMGGAFGCDVIVCPMGSYSNMGRAVGGSRCVPCKSGTSYLGSKVCYKNDAPSIDTNFGSVGGRTKGGTGDGAGMSGGAEFAVLLVCILTIATSLFAFMKVHRHLRDRLEQVPQEDDLDDDEYGAVLQSARSLA